MKYYRGKCLHWDGNHDTIKNEKGGDGMALEGFEVYIPTTGDVNLTLTRNGLGVSKAAVSKLNYAAYVKILIDYQGHRMAITETNKEDPEKMEFARKGKNTGLRWSSRDLIKTLCQMNKWTLDNGEKYIIPGEYSVEDGAMIFDFAQATRS